MLDHIQYNYEEIIRQNHTHQDYVMNLFISLLTTKNDIFCLMIQMEKNSWELGTEISADKLVKKATTKYNTMVLQNIWNQTDSKDAKILALTMKLTTAFNTVTATASSSSANNNNGKKKQPETITTSSMKTDT